MAMNRIQFQASLSLPQFIELYGTEQKCEVALEQARWPDGSVAHVVRARSTGSSLAGATSAISAGAVVIKPPSRPVPSWRQQSYL